MARARNLVRAVAPNKKMTRCSEREHEKICGHKKKRIFGSRICVGFVQGDRVEPSLEGVCYEENKTIIISVYLELQDENRR